MRDLKYYKDLKYRMAVEFHPEDSAYFVKFPDLSGCIADGKTPEEAVKIASAKIAAIAKKLAKGADFTQLAKEELEEERRLVYVGVTRAKKQLYLTYAGRRMIFGQSGSSYPSRFLSEISESLIENTNSSYWLNNDFSSTSLMDEF